MSDNPLANIDLGVVETPSAPVGFSADVLARFTTTEAAIAVEKRRRLRRRVWTAAVAIAAVIALVLLWPRDHMTGKASGPSHLDVAGVSGDLTEDAAVAWRIEGNGVHVDQRGTATWTVLDKPLRVEVAGTGVVDAANATIHVEARMNANTTTIGAAAVIGAALTLTVIAGEAKISGGGRELTVHTGHEATVTPGQAPLEILSANDPVALELVFVGDQRWTPKDFRALEDALDQAHLPAGSTIGSVIYNHGEGMKSEGRAAKFHDLKLGRSDSHGRDSDLLDGAALGMASLMALEADRRLETVGKGHDTLVKAFDDRYVVVIVSDGKLNPEELAQVVKNAHSLQFALRTVDARPGSEVFARAIAEAVVARPEPL